MLMMAVETLIVQERRSEAALSQVDELIAKTTETDLPSDEKAPLLGALRALRDESIGKAGRRLAATLGFSTWESRPGWS